ncbi:MAG: hypothetical protein ACTSSG_09305 [Candidatus Heimdallarchaeaceae archaeon]
MKVLHKRMKYAFSLSIIFIFVFVLVSQASVFSLWQKSGAYGYIYENYGLNSPISNAKISLIVNGIVKVVDYSDSEGYYEVIFEELLSNLYPAELKVEKSGIETQYRSITLDTSLVREDFHLDKYVKVRFQGNIIDTGYYEPIYYKEGSDTLSTSIKYYDTQEPVYKLHLSVYNKYNQKVKDIYSNTEGEYNSGYFNIVKGSCILVAGDIHHKPCYQSQSQVFTASSNYQTFNKDFNLNRYLGEAWVWGQIAKEYYEREEPKLEIPYQIMFKSTGSPLYNKDDPYTLADHFITTYLHSPGMKVWNGYYTLYHTKITMWVKNHWSGDESFVKLSKFIYDESSWGSINLVDYVINLGININGQFGLSFATNYDTDTKFYPHKKNEDDRDKGKLLGDFEIYWSKNNQAKNIYLHWFLQADVSKAIQQCGSHLTFKIKFENWFRRVNLVGTWAKSQYYVCDTLTLGDGQLEPDSIAINFDPWYNLWPGTISFS